MLMLQIGTVQGYRQLKIRHPHSAPYRPQQMNGAVEAEKKKEKIKNKNPLFQIAITYRDWHKCPHSLSMQLVRQ